MNELVTIEQIVTIVKDVGIAALVLFVFYRYIIAQGKDSERSDALQNSLIQLNTKAIQAFERISTTLEHVSKSQEQSTIAQERASALQEQSLQRHIDNGRNIVATVDAVKDLGLNWKNYNALVDGTVSILSGNVGEMRSTLISVLGRMDALESAMRSLPKDDAFARLTDHMTVEIGKAKMEILQRFPPHPTPPTEPASAAPKDNVTPLHADAGAHDAAVLPERKEGAA